MSVDPVPEGLAKAIACGGGRLGDLYPLADVDWHMATHIAGILGTLTGLGDAIRLPSEVEWEYCCRAGRSDVDYRREVERCAWLEHNSGGVMQPIGLMPRNGFGLRDMVGNVLCWYRDGFELYPGGSAVDWVGGAQDEIKSIRGTSFRGTVDSAMPYWRGFISSSTAVPELGMRLVVRSPSKHQDQSTFEDSRAGTYNGEDSS